MKRIFTFLVLFAAMGMKANAQTRIDASEISKHLNDSVTTSQKITGGRVLERAHITLLYLGGTFPEHLFTIVIKDPARSLFKIKSPDELKGKDVKVTGRVTEYGGRPQIAVTDLRQLKIE
jgi:DNA/RNA endonuclease YhcR with UshA esterase domain